MLHVASIIIAKRDILLLAVTPNPALDRTLVVPGLRLGTVHRAERCLIAAGGKGLNVARAARTLGQPALVCAPLGGVTGQQVARLATEEGFAAQWSWHSAGETRTCVLVIDPHGEDATVINEPGPTLSSSDWQTFVATVSTAAITAHVATISGSLPPGVPAEGIGALIATLQAAGCRVIVDTSGSALVAALTVIPYAIKVNRHELSAALNMPLHNQAHVMAALMELRMRGIALGVVTLGAEGALAINPEGIYYARPPAQAIVSSVGSGDSLLAGLTTGLLREYTLPEALRMGVACGTADALTIGGGLLDMADVDRILAQTTGQWLSG